MRTARIITVPFAAALATAMFATPATAQPIDSMAGLSVPAAQTRVRAGSSDAPCALPLAKVTSRPMSSVERDRVVRERRDTIVALYSPAH
jgi:hypothetical protein